MYYQKLRLEGLSSVYIKDSRELLNRFKKFLDENPPLPELAEDFLAQFTERKHSTFLRYFNIVQRFMRWYGYPLEIKPKATKLTPAYVSDVQVQKLISAAKDKKSHKKKAARDVMLIELAINTGMRRSELARLTVGDFDLERGRVQVMGKGGKRRTITLPPSTLDELKKYNQIRPHSALQYRPPAPEVKVPVALT